MSNTKNKKLNIALIGAGGMGRRWANAIKRVPDANLYFVCDTDETKAELITRVHVGARMTLDWKVAADHPEIDAAIVVLPHHLLAKVSEGFLREGKHVLSEKPAGVSSKEIEKVTALAKKKHLRYMVGFNHRQHDAFLKMETLFNKGVIGKLLFIRARYGFGGRAGYEKEWRLNKKLSGGGELIDQGVHMIDMSRKYLGHVTKATGFVTDNFWHGTGEDNAYALLKNKHDVVATLHISWTHWKPEHIFELYGTKGYLIVEGLGKKYGGKEMLKVGIRDPKYIDPVKETIIECDNDADSSLVRELKVFIDSIRKPARSGEKDPVCDGNNAAEVLKIVESIYKQNAKK